MKSKRLVWLIAIGLTAQTPLQKKAWLEEGDIAKAAALYRAAIRSVLSRHMEKEKQHVLVPTLISLSEENAEMGFWAGAQWAVKQIEGGIPPGPVAIRDAETGIKCNPGPPGVRAPAR